MRLTRLRPPAAPFDETAARWLRPLPRSGVLAFPATVEYAAALEVPRGEARGVRGRFWLGLVLACLYAACAFLTGF